MPMTAVEQDVHAPVADAIVTVLKLHLGDEGAVTFGEIDRVVARLLDYDDGLPVSKARHIPAARALLRDAAGHSEYAAAERDIRRATNARHSAADCEAEARTIIRHHLTLEGPDL